MANPITGYTSNKSVPKAAHATVNPVDQFKNALDVLASSFVQLIASDAVEANSTTTVINATAHSAKAGDRIRFTSGSNQTFEVSVLSTATNTITLAQELPSAPAAADAFNIYRHAAPLVDSGGNIFIAFRKPTTSELAEAKIDFSTTGDNTIVAAVAAQTIRLHKIFFVVSADTNITIKDGASGLTGVITMKAGGSFVLDMDGDPWFTCSTNTALVINQSGTAQISGRVYYRQS